MKRLLFLVMALMAVPFLSSAQSPALPASGYEPYSASFSQDFIYFQSYASSLSVPISCSNQSVRWTVVITQNYQGEHFSVVNPNGTGNGSVTLNAKANTYDALPCVTIELRNPDTNQAFGGQYSVKTLYQLHP